MLIYAVSVFVYCCKYELVLCVRTCYCYLMARAWATRRCWNRGMYRSANYRQLPSPSLPVFGVSKYPELLSYSLKFSG